MKLTHSDKRRIAARKERRRLVDRQTRFMHEGRKRMAEIHGTCEHTAWMNLYSLKQRICYDCGKVETITNDMPVHTR